MVVFGGLGSATTASLTSFTVRRTTGCTTISVLQTNCDNNYFIFFFNLALVPNCHIAARAPTTSRARLRCSTILSPLGPDHALTVLFLGTHTRTSQWVTHHGIALARYSLNFGVSMNSEASELPKGLVLGRDGNVHIRLRGSTHDPLLHHVLTYSLCIDLIKPNRRVGLIVTNSSRVHWFPLSLICTFPSPPSTRPFGSSLASEFIRTLKLSE